MDAEKLYQRRVGRTRLEIAGLYEAYLAAIYYKSSGGLFEQGALDVPLDAALAMLEELRTKERLEQFFFGPFEPMVPHGSSRRAEAREAFAALEARLEGRPQAEIGERKRLSGVWLDAGEALALLRELGPRLGALSAEESSVRLILLEKDENSAGWDLLHRDGATYLGRWDGNGSDRPGTVGLPECGRLEAALEAARAVLERRIPQADRD